MSRGFEPKRYTLARLRVWLGYVYPSRAGGTNNNLIILTQVARQPVVERIEIPPAWSRHGLPLGSPVPIHRGFIGQFIGNSAEFRIP